VRLKELTLQGYKSFASKHRFLFPSGITAVVGPNGSGKSNIADGIRWVLGEQRAAHLRARKSEELIFHGTERRARAGLAEVTLLLDNSDRGLDVDFAEVSITRRAHRDGTTEYLVNGARVRLRDVLDLLGSQLGQSNYTVIGQGLVDNALALRPEDRRGLIDEAAGLVPLQRKRDRALRQLEEGNENLTRVLDILADLGPRLKRMERLAERAQQHRRIAAELEGLLKVWYGHQWHRAVEQWQRAQASQTEAAADAEAARAEVAALQVALRQAETRAEAADDELATWRVQREVLTQSAAEARQGLAVSQARLESLAGRAREIEREVEGLASDIAGLADREAALGDEVALLATDHARHQAELAAARAALAAAEADHEARAQAAEVTRTRLFAHSSETAALQQRAAALTAQVEGRTTERDTAAASLAHFDEQTAVLAGGSERAAAALIEAEAAVTAVTLDIAAAEARRDEVDQALRDARDAHAQATTAAAALRARAGALDALVSELDEVRPVLARLEAAGIGALGTVANLLDVTPGWDAAVAAALGHRVQGVVLPDQAAVDAALAALTSAPVGQVTLVPLTAGDTPYRAWAPAVGTLDADAVATAPRARGLVAAVLGGTAFVEDVPAARAALAATPGPAQAATRDGRLVLPGGVIVAGAPGAELLALHRERRALPEAIATAMATAASRAAAVDGLAEQRRNLEVGLGDLAEQRASAERTRAAAAEAAAQASAELDQLRRARDWAAATLARLDEELATLAGDAAAVQRALAQQGPAEEALRAELRSLQAGLEAVDLAAHRQAVTAAAEQGARSAEALAGRRAGLDATTRDLDAARARLLHLRQRLAETHTGIADTTGAIQRQTAAADRLAAELAALAERIAPAESDMRSSRGSLRSSADRLEEARRRLEIHEARVSESRLASTRAEDRLERLYDQLRADSEWLPEAGDLPQPMDVASVAQLALQSVPELPTEIERQMGTLRRELRAIGAIDLEALSAYEENIAHYHALSAQRADLEAAERDLRQVLQHLETEMQAQFDLTFAAVADAFARYFPQLFGGGEAALVLTGGSGDAPPGIDIVARPPGKRSQALSLLSGGERALTAVALIFALLEVSTTPFVVLDEVDAALDEANVDRFCTALRDLAEHTQVVIITHNRNTIQTAGTVYGVTMGDDGASQTVSLRVEAMA
jgi:chromosome segregation protein